MKDSLSLVTLSNPRSVVAESYKMLRTNLHYMNVDNACQTILFTSSLSGEGKTTSVVNTGIAFAQAGKKVLIIDCDLRKSRVHALCKINQSPGLTHYLADSLPIENLIQQIDGVDNLFILTSGIQPPNPSEILNTSKMELLIEEFRKRYDYILIDCPPVIAVTDAMVVAKYVDGVVLIVATNETKVDAIQKSKKIIEKVGAKLIGVLLTKVVVENKKYLQYYSNAEIKKAKI